MLYGLVIAIHVIASLILIAVILLQAGRGGGLSESFGGSSTQTIFGTKTNVFLSRATAASAIIYIITCLTLAVMTGHKGRSLVAKDGFKMPVTQGQQGNPGPLSEGPMDY
jgi:preprotein translocase subunit SecG